MSTAFYPGDRGGTIASPPNWHDYDGPAHSVQFYADDQFLVTGLSRYVGSALGAGDSAIVIATQAPRNSLVDKLRVRGLDVALAAEHGRYAALDAAETLSRFMRDGQCSGPTSSSSGPGERPPGPSCCPRPAIQ